MKYITVLLFCALGFASSCSNMLDQYSHSAIPPEAVTEKDLPALRLGMYNRVQNEPQTRSFIMCDILGGDITQSNYNPIDVINSTLSPLNSAIVNGWNGDVTVASADDGRAFTIQLDDIPENACIKLGAQRDIWDSLSINGTDIERETVVTTDHCTDELSNTLIFQAH